MSGSSSTGGLNHFVQLTESGQTVNLSHIANVSWHEVPEGWEDSDCQATITLASGYYVCITPNDAQELWEAMNRYNTRMGQAMAALPQLVNAVAALVEAQLVGAGFEEYYQPPQSTQQQATPAASRPAGSGNSSTPPPTSPGVPTTPPPSSDHAGAWQPQAGNPNVTGSNIATGKVRVSPANSGATQPVGQRQRYAANQ